MCSEEVLKYMSVNEPKTVVYAIDAGTQFARTLVQHNEPKRFLKLSECLISKNRSNVYASNNYTLTITMLESFHELLRLMPRPTHISKECKRHIVDIIEGILNVKMPCQCDDKALEKLQPHHLNEVLAVDVKLFGCVERVFLCFGRALPPEVFHGHFRCMLTFLAQKRKKAKAKSGDKPEHQQRKEIIRCFVFAFLAKSIDTLGVRIDGFYASLWPIFRRGLEDDFAEARRNAIFGVGELVFYCKLRTTSNDFGEIVSNLLDVADKAQDGLTLDKVAGALARVIIVYSTQMQMDKLIEILIHLLPIRLDIRENDMVFKCFTVLFAQDNRLFLSLSHNVIAIGSLVLERRQYVTDGRPLNNISMMNNVSYEYNPFFFQKLMRSSPNC